MRLEIEIHESGMVSIMCTVCGRWWNTTQAGFLSDVKEHRRWFLESCKDCYDMADTRKSIDAGQKFNEMLKEKVAAYTNRFPKFATYVPANVGT